MGSRRPADAGGTNTVSPPTLDCGESCRSLGANEPVARMPARRARFGTALYRVFTAAAYPVLFPWLARKYTEGFDERRGFYSEEKRRALPASPLWIHAVSAGEAQSAWPLLHELPRGLRTILSTTTTTGREMAYRLAQGLFDAHVYYPWDFPRVVDRTLESVRPRGYIVLETEIWPNMLFSLRRRGVPAFLVNGRFSERTAGNIRKHPLFWRMVYDCFTLLLVRSDTDREILLSLGIGESKLRVTGDCKVDALLLRRKRANLAPLESLFGARRQDIRRDDALKENPVFLAGSTHEGEERIVLEAFRPLRERFPSARLVIAPRHPERAESICAAAEEFAPARLFSAVADGDSSVQGGTIVVVDRIGLLFELYGVADAAFIGGSLVDKGGQNILEPAAFGTPLSHGPFMRDFVDAARALKAAGVAAQVETAAEIAEHWEKSLRYETRERVRAGAESYFKNLGGAARLSVDEINGVMPL